MDAGPIRDDDDRPIYSRREVCDFIEACRAQFDAELEAAVADMEAAKRAMEQQVLDFIRAGEAQIEGVAQAAAQAVLARSRGPLQ